MQGIVEKVSGLGFEEYMKRNIWQPAGMLTSSLDVPSRIVPHRGKGYVRDAAGVLINTPYEDVSYKYAGGGIISSVEDMVKLAEALNRGMLLKPATLDKMYTPYFNKYEKAFRGAPNPTQVPQWQGLLWFVGKDSRGRSWYGHSGTVKGTRCFIMNYPKEQVVVAIQANIGSIRIDEYAFELAQLVLAETTKN